MADIDNLEIKISADSSRAADNVLALANSLEQLSTSLSGNVRNQLNIAAEGIVSVKSAVSGMNTTAEGIKKLSESLKEISGFKPIEGFDKIVKSLEPIKRISELAHTISDDKSLDKAAVNLGKFIGACETYSNAEVNTENLKKIAEAMRAIYVRTDAAKSFVSVTKAIKSLNGVTVDESLTQSLRDFVGVIRDISDEDADKLKDLATAASAFKNRKIDVSPSDTESKSSGVKEQADEYKYYINVASAFGAVLKGLGHTAAFVANTSFKALGVAVNATNTAFQVGMRGISSAVKGVFSPITAVGKKMKEASEKMGTFLSSIKRIALYRAIRTALKAISEGIKEGRENLYQYSLIAGTQFAKSMDMAATSFLYLKNSIGAATAPLTNYFVPIIDKVVDRIVELINKFNELTAVLTGADTWTKALKYPTQWQEAADDANKSAKKLKSTMLGFDELNVIEPSDSSSKSKLEDALDYSRMFEEVKTDMQSVFDGVDLTLPIKLALDSEGDNTLKSIINTWEKIRSLVQSVAKSFKTVWMNGTGQKTLELFLQIIQNISDTIGNVAEGIKNAWDEGDKGTEIIQHIWNSANNVLTVVRDIWGSLKDWAGNINWNPLFDTFDELTKTIESITSPESSIMRGFKALFTDALEPIGTILIEEGLPAAFDLLNSSLAALEKLADSIDLEYLVSDLGYIAELTFSNISGLVSGLSAVISIASGVDVAEQDIDNLEKAYQRLVDFFGGEDSDYAFIAQELENKGLFGFGDSLGQYIFDVFNKDKLDGFSWKESFDQMGLDFDDGKRSFLGHIKHFILEFDESYFRGMRDVIDSVEESFKESDFGKGLEVVMTNLKNFFDGGWEELLHEHILKPISEFGVQIEIKIEEEKAE